MSKKTPRTLPIASWMMMVALPALFGIAVMVPESPEPVKAQTVETSALYKIASTQTETTPIGCVGCPSMTTSVPTFDTQTSVDAIVASASEIDSFSSSAWDHATSTTKEYKGGCALINGGMRCWGDNSYGQLGNESTTASLTTPVVATENGAAISGITDISTNGQTTCIVTNGTLKCVGAGNWEGNTSVRDQRSTTIYTYTDANTPSQSTSYQYSTTYYSKVTNADGATLYENESTNWIPESMVSSKWTSLSSLGSNVRKVQVGAINGSTPTICALLANGEAKCASITAGTPSNSTLPPSQDADCDGITTEPRFEKTNAWGGCDPSELGGRTTYSVRSESTYRTTTAAATWTWKDAGVTGATDIAMTAESWGASNVCFAGATTICRPFTNGDFGTATTIENGENSEAVYITSNWGMPSLCVYSNDTMSCGSGVHSNTGPTMTTKVTPVAVMQKPLNVFYGSADTMQKIYFLVPSGILSADSWIFSCTNCGSSNTNVLSPVTAFKSSTSTEFTYAKSINGATDSVDFIPMTVVTGTRRVRSSVSITVKTASGENVTGVSVRWVAPDAPGVLSSSATSTTATDSTGAARSSLPSGPVTFTLSPQGVNTTTMGPTGPSGMVTTTTAPAGTTAGRLASGATLQAASITVLVGESGAVTVTVPDPPTVVNRKVSVTLPDGTPVPGATVQLKNTYLTYAYQNSGGSTATWASRPRDTQGFMGQMYCAYCFVAPPRYATGSDGSVTFPSFNLAARSAAYDADVAYDDGDLNQNVRTTFTSLSHSVGMPFMAAVKAVVADSDPSTPETEVVPAANGAVTVESNLTDEDNIPISELDLNVETVTAGCDSGGLVSSTAKSDTVCATNSVATASLGRSSGVSAASARAANSCTSVLNTKTNAAGKASLTVCPTVSTKYRIRGKGAVPSKTFCVVVNNIKCGAVSSGSPVAGAPTATSPTGSSKAAPKIKTFKAKKSARVALTKYLKPAKKSTATYKVTKGGCKVSGKVVVMPKKKATCTLTMTQKTKTKVKGKWKTTTTRKSVYIKVA